MQDYKRLQVQYNQLLAEYDKVVSENLALKNQLGITVSVQNNIPNYVLQPPVHHHSTNQEKIALFRSLFRGREDVYAKRWQYASGEKSGYSPFCQNEWRQGVCRKPKQQCQDCPSRALAPLTDDVIEKHLRGADPSCRDVLGIYPMLTDETTYFLAVDFDGTGWEKDATCFFCTCKEFQIDAALERSRSGNGAHVWMFFDEALAAKTARKLGSCLLTETMRTRHQVRFSSYDRFFPSQDTLPTGGFGNLIAVPLQGQARKKGNSVFVDENMVPYQDQWAFLSLLKKNRVESVLQLLDQWTTDELGELNREDFFVAKNTTGKSAKLIPSQQIVSPPFLSKQDYSDELCITRANMLFMKKAGLSSSVLDRIKRLAAFKNPDFFRSQAMRLPIWNKPRIISTSEESEEILAIPRGLEEPLVKLLQESKIIYKIHDQRPSGTKIAVSFLGSLYQEQQTAAEAILAYENGVLSATTAFGKTVIGAYMIAQKSVNTLVLVHSRTLLSQWQDSLARFLGLEKIGLLGAGKKSLTGIVDVAIIQSLTRRDTFSERIKDYGMVLVDECHHVSAFTFEQVLKTASARYVYGLTATPERSDGLHPIIFMQCGPIRYKVDAKSQALRRGFDHFIVPRITRYKSFQSEDKNLLSALQDIYTGMIQDDRRNTLIGEDVCAATEKGRHSIVLTQRKLHAQVLVELLKPRIKNIVLLTGEATQLVRRASMETLKNIPDTEAFVIVATGKYVGEGFDEPRLDTLFLAMPIAWKGTLAQYAGRLHRRYDDKTNVIVYDYVDVREKMLESMFHKRSKGYIELGYKTMAHNGADEKVGVIFNDKNFFQNFSHDLALAHQEIVVVSPFMRKNRANQMLNVFQQPLSEEVKIHVITRSSAGYLPGNKNTVQEVSDFLIRHGVNVHFQDAIHQKFAIIDRRIVWYGSLNFLAYGASEETLMRFENRSLAEELLETVER